MSRTDAMPIGGRRKTGEDKINNGFRLCWRKIHAMAMDGSSRIGTKIDYIDKRKQSRGGSSSCIITQTKVKTRRSSLQCFTSFSFPSPLLHAPQRKLIRFRCFSCSLCLILSCSAPFSISNNIRVGLLSSFPFISPYRIHAHTHSQY